MAVLQVNPSQKVGPMKEVHGIGQPPIIGWSGTSLFHFLEEAGIPYSRLHDVGGGFGGGRFVDIPVIFPDFNADPDDPESYNFVFTDPLIEGLMKVHAEPYYRLGVTIENEVWRKAFHVIPPADNLKWAKICAGIIRHYTKGWANGYHYNIRYWEIWNEPDANPEPSLSNMWQGTFQQYIDLYLTAAKYLKNEFPEIKIGGYALTGFYAAYWDKEGTDTIGQWRLQCADEFLRQVKENNVPLDFFSWHSYSSPEQIPFYADYADALLKKYGFEGVEQHLNEWNWAHELRGTAEHAANTAAMLITMQKSKLDKAMFYDGRCGVSKYGGLFNPMTLEPLKAYWSIAAFNEVFKCGTQIEMASDTDNLFALAAANDDAVLVMIANKTGEAQDLNWELNGGTITSCRIIDSSRDLVPINIVSSIPDNTVMLFTVKY